MNPTHRTPPAVSAATVVLVVATAAAGWTITTTTLGRSPTPTETTTTTETTGPAETTGPTGTTRPAETAGLTETSAAAETTAATPRPVSDPYATQSAEPDHVPVVDHRAPDAVCRGFAETIHRIDTTADTGPTDAYQRAVSYLHATLAAAINRDETDRASPRWQQWTRHHAYTKVRLDPYTGDALNPDHDGETHHAVLVTVSPIGRDGWRGPETHHTVSCTLRLDRDNWRITDYNIE